MIEARSLWIVGPGRAELRRERLAPPREGELLVAGIASALSRGTERLVFQGLVPESEAARMRAPYQSGDFPFPVKYGYSAVGTVAEGPPELRGRRVFALHPHQDRYIIAAKDAFLLPEGVGDHRALLAANLETAINGLWDAAPGIGDRIAVVGAGVVGALTAALAGQIPGTSVQLIDTDAAKARIATALGLGFASPEEARGECDLVVHASGTAEGLATALRLAGFEATVLELSWYGARPVPAPLGEAFHSRRLTLRSSQVGTLPPARRPRWDRRRRLDLALALLDDPGFDALLEPPVPFERLPGHIGELLQAPGRMCQVITYR